MRQRGKINLQSVIKKDNHYCRLRDSIRSHFNPHYLFITDFIYEKITPVEEMQSKTEGSQAEIIWQGINLQANYMRSSTNKV